MEKIRKSNKAYENSRGAKDKECNHAVGVKEMPTKECSNQLLETCSLSTGNFNKYFC
ncbi:hypothetical protein [Sutcliffiella horikoshii]|uniref:hypothetical protein n=1 Tax=Sutcliffiella horikoshii TaxID=79883 RepID=UPI001F202732|nr:hypothetical protein [Sutcliffiella horikoshii]